MSLSLHFSTAEAISVLFHPHAEVIIHDLKSGLIAAIYNNFSKRKVGDESLLDQIDQFPDVFPVYAKTNWNGKTIKSISATLRDSKGKAIGLLCINLDVSKWEEMGRFIESWLKSPSTLKPEALFKDDWRERINTYVSQAIISNSKKEIVLGLYKEGAFKAKNAAAYISDVLDLSRATIYNYLKEHTHD